MTTTQYYTATSIDGVIADVGAMAMGSTTYEWVLAHDQLLDHPEKWREHYGDTPCWVFSSREPPPILGADLRFVRGDVAPVHRAMVDAVGGKNVWIVGGGDLVGQFADGGLLDEIVLNVAPVTIGAGAPLLPRRLLSSELTLVDVERHGQFVTSTYRVGPTEAAGTR